MIKTFLLWGLITLASLLYLIRLADTFTQLK